MKNKIVGSLISTSRLPICSEKSISRLVSLCVRISPTRCHSIRRVEFPSSRVRQNMYRKSKHAEVILQVFFFRSCAFFLHPSLSIEKRDLFYRSAVSPVSRPFAKLDLSIYTVGAGRIRRGSGRIIKIYREKSTLCISDKSKIRGWILWTREYLYYPSFRRPGGVEKNSIKPNLSNRRRLRCRSRSRLRCIKRNIIKFNNGYISLFSSSKHFFIFSPCKS